MHSEHNRAARADVTPASATAGLASGPPATTDGRIHSTIPKPCGRRRHHCASGRCVGDATDAVSGFSKDPPPAHRDCHRDESATVCGVVMGGATLENLYVPFQAISTGDLIRQQHRSRTYSSFAICALENVPRPAHGSNLVTILFTSVWSEADCTGSP